MNKTTLKILTQDFRVNKRWLFPFRLHVRQIWGPNWVFEMESVVVFASVECSDRICPVKLWKMCDKNQSLGNSRGFHIEILGVTYDMVNQRTFTKSPSLLCPDLAEILFQIVPSNGTLICNTVSFFLSPLMLLSPVAPLVSFCSSSLLNLKKKIRCTTNFNGEKLLEYTPIPLLPLNVVALWTCRDLSAFAWVVAAVTRPIDAN